MSLAIAVVTKDYIITSSDSAVAFFHYDVERYERTGEFVRTGGMERNPDVTSDKVEILSDNVYLVQTGANFLAETVRVELSHLVNEKDDLQSIMKQAKKVIQDMRKKEVPHWEEVIDNLSNEFKDLSRDKEEYFSNLEMMEDEKNLTAYLVGFNNDGSSGMYGLMQDAYIESLDDVKKGYPYFINGEHPGYSEDPANPSLYQQLMTLPREKRTYDGFIEATSIVHALISYQHNINVSSDCNFKAMVRNNDKIEHYQFTIETKELYERLGLEPK